MISEVMRFLRENESKPATIKQRRSTTTATNLFSVDGDVFEASSDFLTPVVRSQPVESVRICNDFDPFKRMKNIPFSIGGRKRAVSTFAESSPYADQ